jgi:ATP-dependent Lon protease
VLPEKNKKDLVDVPKEVLDTVEIKTVGTIDEVLRAALVGTGRLVPGQRDVGRPAPPPLS